MCNEQRYTESGAPIAPTRCAEYNALKYDRDGWRNSFDRLFLRCKEKDEENARLRSTIANVITEYDACDNFNNEGRAAELINVTLRDALKEVEE